MCESVEKYGAEREAKGEARGKITGTVNAVRKLMENMKFSMEEALDALGITGDERHLIIEQLKK